MTFSEPVVVEGAPTLKIKVGDATKSADYAGGAGTDALSFTYTIAANEANDAGGISIPADAIVVSASGVKITDIAGNAASVTQAEVADNSAFKVALDTTAPAVSVNSIATDNKIAKVEHDGLTWFTGKGEAGASIKIEIGSGGTFTAASTELARVDEFGRWMVPYSASDLPADGTYEVRVTATDAAGNASQAVISSLLIDSVVPTATVPGAQTIVEDVQTAIAGLSVADADTTGDLTVTLSVSSGVLAVNTSVTDGLASGEVTNNGTATVTLTGTATQINNTLANGTGLQYTGGANFNGSDTLTIVTTDGANSDSDTVAITVSAANDAPTLSGDNAVTVSEGGRVQLTTSDFNYADVDDGETDVTFTVTPQSSGSIEISGTTGTTFTARQLKDGDVYFVHDGTEEVSSTFTVAIEDGNEDSSDTPASATVNVTVSAVNDEVPVNTVPGAQTIVEDVQTAIAGLSVADADTTGDLTVTLSVSSGVLAIRDDIPAGLASGEVTNNGTATVTLTGTATQINNTLANGTGLQYTGGANFNGSDTLTIVTTDGANSDSDTVAITVSAANDAPTLSGDNAVTVSEGGRVQLTTSDFNYADVDDGETDVTFTVTPQSSGSIEISGTTGTTFTARQLKDGDVYFVHDGTEEVSSTFTVAIEDGNEDSSDTPASATVNVTVSAVNDEVPVNTVPGAQTIVEDVQTAIAGLSVADADTTGDLTVTLSVSSGVLAVNTSVTDGLASGEVTNNGTATVTLTGTATQINNTLANGTGLQYTGGANFNGSDTLTIVTTDGANSDSDTVAITVSAANDAPTLSGDNAVTVSEGGRVQLTTSDFNYADVDDGETDVTFTVTPQSSGSIEISGTTGTTFTARQLKDGDVYFVHDGTEEVSSTFTVAIEDGNEDSSDTPASATVNVTVSAVNDEVPVNTVPGAQTIVEDVQTAIAGLSVADADTTGDLTVTLSVSSGVLAIRDDIPAGLASGEVTNNGTATVTLTGTATQINNTLANGTGLQYTGGANFNGSDTLTIVTTDGANSDSDTVAITVSAANDAPTLSGDNAVTVSEGGRVQLTTSDFNYADVDDGETDVTFTVTPQSSGSIEISGTTGTTFTARQLKDGDVYFVHDGTEEVSSTFTVAIEDGNEDSSDTPASATVNVTVSAVNDEVPVNTVPGAQTIVEDVQTAIAGLSVADADTTGDLTVTLSVSSGVLAVNTSVTDGLASGEVTNNGTATVTLTGTATQINNTLANGTGLQYTGGANFNGSDTLTIVTTDGANSDSDTVAITVSAANDAPTLSGDNAVTVSEGGRVQLTTSDFNYADVDDGETDVTFTVTPQSSGSIEISGTTGTTFTARQLKDGDVYFVHDGTEEVSSTFTVAIEDGNEDSSDTPASATVNVTVSAVDDTAPSAPTISVSTPTKDTTPDITITAESGSTVKVYADGVLLGSASEGLSAGGNSTFTLTAPTLVDGNYVITATATDVAGNVSAQSSLTNLVVDSTLPVAPTITAISGDSGTVGDKITSDDTLIISGTAEAGSQIVVSITGTGELNGGSPVTADANGAWSYDYTGTSLADGNYSFTAVATDSASNASSATSPAYVVKVDTDADTDSNFAVAFATADDTTNASEVSHVSMTLSGVDSDAASVSVSIDDAAVGSPIVRSASKVGSDWVVPDVDISTLSDGTVTVTATVTDDAGNTATATDTLTLDTTAPTATIAVIAGDDEINVAENTAGFNITGTTTAEDGSTVTISFESGATLDGGNTATVASNAWSIAVAAKEAGDKFKEGDELVTITVTDTAGNTSSEVSRLSEVVSTQSTSGDQSASDFSGVTVLTLIGATTLPSATDRLPTKIVADGKEITMAGAAIDLTGVTLDRVGNLTLTDANSQITMSPNQATAFNAGAVTLAGGAILVTTSGDLSSQDLANVTLTLNGATTLVDHNDDLPLSIDADSNAITVGDDLNVTGVTLTQLGTVSIDSTKTLTALASQVTGQTVSGAGSLSVTTATAATEYDFAAITVSGTKTINYTVGGTVHSNFSTYIDGFSITVAGGQTLTLTEAQIVSDITKVQTAGSIVVDSGAVTGTSQTNVLANITTFAADGVTAITFANDAAVEADKVALADDAIADNSITLTDGAISTSQVATLADITKFKANQITSITFANDAAVEADKVALADDAIADNSITLTAGAISTSQVATLADITKFKANQITSITFANDAAVEADKVALADDAIADNSITLTDGAISTSQVATLADITKFKANQITSITFANDAAVEADKVALADDAIADNSITLTAGAISTSQVATLADITKFKANQITSITFANDAAVEADKVALADDAIADNSITLTDGAISTSQVATLADITKFKANQITSITFANDAAVEADKVALADDAIADNSITLTAGAISTSQVATLADITKFKANQITSITFANDAAVEADKVALADDAIADNSITLTAGAISTSQVATLADITKFKANQITSITFANDAAVEADKVALADDAIADNSITLTDGAISTSQVATLADITKFKANQITSITFANDAAVEADKVALADDAIADNSITLTAGAISTSQVATLADITKFKANQITSITFANDAAVEADKVALADDAIADNSITLTAGAITTAQAAVVSDITKFKANQVTAITLSEGEVNSIITDDALAAGSVTVGSVTGTSQTNVLANITKFATDGVTSITFANDAAVEADKVALADDAIADNSITLTAGAISTSQVATLADITKFKANQITSITFANDAAVEADKVALADDAIADNSITLTAGAISTSQVATLADITKFKANQITSITFANDAAVEADKVALADDAIADNSITLTAGAISTSQVATLADITKFKANQITSITFANDAAVEADKVALADDAIADNSITLTAGAISTSQVATLADITKFKANQITSITFANDAAVEADKVALADDAIADNSITLTAGAISTSQVATLADITKFKANQITAITFANDAAVEADKVALADDAIADNSITLTDGAISTSQVATLADITKFKANQITSITFANDAAVEADKVALADDAIADNSITLTAGAISTSQVATLADITKFKANQITSITFANDAAVEADKVALADDAIADNSITLTAGAITTAQAAVVSDITKFKANQVTAITLSEGEVNSIITDDALAAGSVTVGSVTGTSQTNVLANITKFATDGVTSITFANDAAVEADKVALADDAIADNSITLTAGAISTSQVATLADITKFKANQITSITFANDAAVEADKVALADDAIADNSITLTDGAISTSQVATLADITKFKANQITSITFANDAAVEADKVALADDAIADNSITLTAGAISTSQVATLADITKFKANQITAITFANDAAVEADKVALADDAIADNSITLTDGAISTSQVATLADITKFKANQITSITFANDAAVEADKVALADDAIADNSITLTAGAISTSQVATLADITKFKANQITSITFANDAAVEADKVALADDAIADNSITLTAGAISTSQVATLADITKFKANQITSITFANDAAVEADKVALADDAIADNSITLTDGAITTAQAAVVSDITKFKANQVTAITLSEGEVNSIITDDALAAGSVTVGSVTGTSQTNVLANITKFATDGVTSITFANDAAVEADKVALADDAIADNSITLTAGAISTSQVATLADITKFKANQITSITFANDAAVEADKVALADDAIADNSITLTDGAISTSQVATLADITKFKANQITSITFANDAAVEADKVALADDAIADNSITLTAGAISTSQVATLADITKFKANQITSITFANDAAVEADKVALADDAIADNSITLTDGAITTAQAAVVSDITKFKANQVTAITLSEGEVNSIITDDALAAGSVTVGSVTGTSQTNVLANITKFATDGVTSITFANDAAVEADKVALADDAIADNSITLTAGAISTSQVATLADITKFKANQITSITFANDAAVEADKVALADDAIADNSITLTDGAISTSQVATLADITKFKANQITSITFANDAAVEADKVALADDAIADNSITLTAGAISTSQVATLADITKFKANQITAITFANDAAVEADKVALADDAIADNSITLTDGAISTSQVATLADITKFKANQITSITFANDAAVEADKVALADDAIADNSITLTAGAISTSQVATLADITKFKANQITSITFANDAAVEADKVALADDAIADNSITLTAGAISTSQVATLADITKFKANQITSITFANDAAVEADKVALADDAIADNSITLTDGAISTSQVATLADITKFKANQITSITFANDAAVEADKVALADDAIADNSITLTAGAISTSQVATLADITKFKANQITAITFANDAAVEADKVALADDAIADNSITLTAGAISTSQVATLADITKFKANQITSITFANDAAVEADKVALADDAIADNSITLTAGAISTSQVATLADITKFKANQITSITFANDAAVEADKVALADDAIADNSITLTAGAISTSQVATLADITKFKANQINIDHVCE